MNKLISITMLTGCMMLFAGSTEAHPTPFTIDGFPEFYLEWSAQRGDPSPSQVPPGPGRNRLEMLRIWKLTEYLDLDEAQAARFFPALQAHREEMQSIDSTAGALQKEMMDRIESAEISQNRVNTWRDQLGEYRSQKLARERRFLESLDEYLSPVQQARYMVFERRFQEILRNEIMRRRPWRNSPNN